MVNDFEREVREVVDGVARMLVEKNAAYGDSALSPLRIFSKAEVTEQIRVRLDDKLSRLARGSSAGEDVELDLIGYLVLLRIARKREASASNNDIATSLPMKRFVERRRNFYIVSEDRAAEEWRGLADRDRRGWEDAASGRGGYSYDPESKDIRNVDSTTRRSVIEVAVELVRIGRETGNPIDADTASERAAAQGRWDLSRVRELIDEAMTGRVWGVRAFEVGADGLLSVRKA